MAISDKLKQRLDAEKSGTTTTTSTLSDSTKAKLDTAKQESTLYKQYYDELRTKSKAEQAEAQAEAQAKQDEINSKAEIGKAKFLETETPTMDTTTGKDFNTKLKAWWRIATGGYDWINKASESEQNQYYAYLADDDEENADAYKKYLNSKYSRGARIAQNVNEHFEEVKDVASQSMGWNADSVATDFGKEVVALPLSVGGIVDYATAAAQFVQTGEISNASATGLSEAKSLIQAGVNENIVKNTKGTGWDVSGTKSAEYSGIDNLATFLAGTGYSAAQSYLVGATLGPAGTIILGGDAAATTLKEALDEGESPDSALGYALLVGTWEAFFEYASFDKVIRPSEGSGLKVAAKNFAKATFHEATEEFNTEIADMLTDIAFHKDTSEWAVNKAEYIATHPGATEAEANSYALRKFFGQAGGAALGGAISGGLMGAAGDAVGNMAQNNAYNRTIQSDKAGTVANVKEIATKAGKTYADNLTENSSDKEIAKAMRNVSTDIQNDAIRTRLAELGIDESKLDSYTDTVRRMINKNAKSNTDLANKSIFNKDSKIINQVVKEAKSNAEWSAKSNAAIEAVLAPTTAKYAPETAGTEEVTENTTETEKPATEAVTPLTEKQKTLLRDIGRADKIYENEVAVDNMTAEENIVSFAKANNVTPEDLIADFNGLKANNNHLLSDSYINALDMAYTYAKTGAKLADVQKNIGYTSDGINKMYNKGLEDYKTSRTQTYKDAETRKKGYAPFDGKTRYATSQELADAEIVGGVAITFDTKITDEQKAQMGFWQEFYKNTAVNVAFFIGEGSANGGYANKRNTVYIDIGSDMIRTGLHEFTHAMRENSPQLYEELRNYVIAELFDGSEKSFVNEVERKYKFYNDTLRAEWLKKHKNLNGYQEYSKDSCAEEVIADSVKTAFDDMEKVQQFASKHKNLFKKLVEFFKKFAQTLKNAIAKYGSVDNPYAKALSENKKAVDKVLDIMMRARAEMVVDVSATPVMDATDAKLATMTATEVTDDIAEKTNDMAAYSLPYDSGITDDYGKHTMYSVSAAINAGGMTWETETVNGKQMLVIKTANGNYITQDTKIPAIVDTLRRQKSPLNILLDVAQDKINTITDADRTAIYNAMAQFYHSAITYGRDATQGKEKLDAIWKWVGSDVFRAIKTNGDKQYGISNDLQTVCKKTEMVLDAISDYQVATHRGTSPAEVMRIYLKTGLMGYQTPCPFCYVFSHWIRMGLLLETAASAEEHYKDHLTPAGLNDLAYWKKEYTERKTWAQKNKNKIDDAKKDIQDILDIIDEFSPLLAKAKAQNNQSAIDEIQSIVDTLNERYVKAYQLVSLSDYAGWISNCIYNPKGNRLRNEYKIVDKDILFDFRRVDELVRNYPALARFRVSKGSQGGKAVENYADNKFGEVIAGVESGGDRTARNTILEMFNGNATAEDVESQIATAIKNVRKQNLRGGQRFFSWSDNRIDTGVDMLLNFIQFSCLGSAVQSYTKQLEGLEFISAMGGYCNASLVGNGVGFKNPKYDSNGKVIGGELVFSSLQGIQADTTFELNKRYDKAGNILVGMNDTHIAIALNDKRIFFVIPWHRSGLSNNLLFKMMQMLEEPYVEEGSDESSAATDYTKYQEEKFYTKNLDGTTSELKDLPKELTNLFKSIENLDVHGYKASSIRGFNNVKVEDGKLSQSQLEYRKLRNKVMTGQYLTDEELIRVVGDEFLSIVRKAMIDEKITSWGVDDVNSVYPYEYWDIHSTYETAYRNNVRYLEYCRRLGIQPKFCGINSDGVVTNPKHGDFTDQDGYWKVLVDRRMYDTHGNYQGLTPVSLSNVKKTQPGYLHELITPEGIKSREEEYAKIGLKYKVTKIADMRGAKAIANAVQESMHGLDTIERVSDNAKALADYDAISKGKSLKEYYGTGNSYLNEEKAKIESELNNAKYSLKDSDGNTLTEAQAEYFKDSKVRDENGNLQVVYHGSKFKIFTEFNGGTVGNFFTDNAEIGSAYSGNITDDPEIFHPSKTESFETYVNYLEDNGALLTKENGKYKIEDDNGITTLDTLKDVGTYVVDNYITNEFGGATYGCYLNITNPLVVECNGRFWNNLPETLGETMTDGIAEQAKAKGYDGVFFRNIIDGGSEISNVYVTFKADQQKDTYNTNPTSNKDIRYSLNEENGIEYVAKSSDEAIAHLVSFFSGGGTVDAKMKESLGKYLKQVAVVEKDDRISKAYALNEKGDVIGLGESIDVIDFLKTHRFMRGEVNAFHASPSCCNFSGLKNIGDQKVDELTADATAKFIDAVQPKVFTLENVAGYLKSRSLRYITKALVRNGYRFRIGVYQAAQFGAAANRRRMLLVATREGVITPVTPYLVKSEGWYAKCSDMISSLPDIALAPSIREKLIERGINPENPGDYYFVNGKIQFGHLSAAPSYKPAPTFVASSSQYRILTPDGQYKKVTPDLVKKLMGLSDSFVLPKNEELAFRILGNGVSGELTSSIITPMITQNIVNEKTLTTINEKINEDYIEAVKSGDVETAEDLFNLYVLNKAGANITPFLSATKYNSGQHAHIAKMLKENDNGAVMEAAKEMARLVPKNAVLVPIPSHYGDARDTLVLAKAIGKITHTVVIDALKGEERRSQYEAKKSGKGIDLDEMGIYQKRNLPDDKIPIFIDNVVASGTTASAAVRAVGRGVVLAYAYGDKSNPVAGLKSAEAITFDNNGNVIPLTERFNESSKDIRYSLDEKEYYNKAFLKEETVDRYLESYAIKHQPNTSQAWIGLMRTSEFVPATTSYKAGDAERIRSETTALDEEKLAGEKQPMFFDVKLDVNGKPTKITSHEGRHRSTAMSNAGIQYMPVILFDYGKWTQRDAYDTLILDGQTDSYSTVAVHNVIPLDYAHREEILDKFSRFGAKERVASNYYNVLKYSLTDTITEKVDTPYTVIGNGIPVHLTKAVIGGALESTYKEDYGKTLYSMGNGYNGYSMSNNAVAAYENGEKPWSKWTKTALLNAVKNIAPSKLDIARSKSLEDLRTHLLVYTGWHHTSKYYNKTNFYEVDEERVAKLGYHIDWHRNGNWYSDENARRDQETGKWLYDGEPIAYADDLVAAYLEAAKEITELQTNRYNGSLIETQITQTGGTYRYFNGSSTESEFATESEAKESLANQGYVPVGHALRGTLWRKQPEYDQYQEIIRENNLIYAARKHFDDLARRYVQAAGEKCFIRFGKIPTSGKSYNFASNEYEKGVSVYEAYKIGNEYAVTPANNPFTFLGYVDSKQAYLVDGTELNEYGGDDEPLLSNARIIKKIPSGNVDSYRNVAIRIAKKYADETSGSKYSLTDTITDKELLAEALDSHIDKAEDRATLERYRNSYNESIQRANKITSLKSQLANASTDQQEALRQQINKEQKKLNERNAELKSILTMPRMIAIVKDMREEVNRYIWALQEADDKLLAQQVENGKLSAKLQKKLEAREQSFREYKANVAESKGINYYRPRIEKVTADLIKMVTDKDKKYPLADAFKQPILSIINAMDFSRNNGSKKDQQIIQTQNELQKLYNDMQSPDKFLEKYGTLLPEDMKMWIESVQQYLVDASAVMGPTSISEMNSVQLKALYNLLKSLYTTAKWASKSYTSKATDMQDVATETIGYLVPMRNSKDTKFKALQTMRNFMNWDNATPYTVFERLGTGGEKVYKLLRKGQGKLAFNQQKIEDTVAKLKKDYGITDKQIRGWYDDSNEVVIGGDKMSIPTAEIIELYAALQDEDAYRHVIEGGGVTFAEFNHGKMSITDLKSHLMTEDEIANVFSKLDKNTIKFVDAMHQFLAEYGAELGNEVSAARFGIESFGIKNYFPIKTVESERNDAKIQEERSNLYAMLNQSFTKERNLRANNAIVIGNFFETFAKHMGKMAVYNAYALPVLDTIRWLNYRSFSSGSDGRRVETASVQTEMKNAYGDSMVRYINNLLMSINGTHNSDPTEPMARLALSGVRMYNRVAVTANVRVAVQQPTSIVRAFEVINPKYVSVPADLKATIAEMREHSGIAVWKKLGYFDNNTALPLMDKIVAEDGYKGFVNDVSEKGMMPAEQFDTLTWATLWNAAKNEVNATNPGLSNEAFYEKVTERFEDIIYATQVVDSVLTKSQWMRSKGFLQKVTSSFKGEPTTSYNLVLRTADKFLRDQRVHGTQYAWSQNKRPFIKAITLFSASAILSALVTAPIDAGRDDDDYKTYLQKLWEQFKENALDNINILGSLPFLSDLVETLSGYTVERPDQEIISTILSTCKSFYTALTNGFSYKTAFKFLQAASSISGLPIANVMRDVVGLWNTVIGGLDSSLKLQQTPETNSSGYEAYYTAYKAGKSDRLGELVAEMESNNISEQSMWSGLVSQCREDYKAGGITAAEAKEYLKSTAMLIGVSRTDKQIDKLVAGW